MRRLIVGVALLALVVGAAALGFAAGGHATSKPFRNIDLHFGDHLNAYGIKVFCQYGLNPQGTPRFLCFGESDDPDLVMVWTAGAVHVTRCWNDCGRKEELLTASR